MLNGESLTFGDVAVPAAMSGTFKNLIVDESTAPTGTETVIATLYIGGSSTSLTCTVTGLATQCPQDTTHTASIIVGQDYALQIVPSLSAASARTKWSVEFDPGAIPCGPLQADNSNKCNSVIPALIHM